MCMPCVRRACERNIVPNLPAPITATVTGRPAASRSRSFVWRFKKRSVADLRRKHKHGRGTRSHPWPAGFHWQTARETNVSIRHSGLFDRPTIQTLGGQISAVVMSRLRPESKPFVLQLAVAAATQSGAPFGAICHFSWPLTVRTFGIRATAPAASLAPSTVDFAAAPASWLNPSTFSRASLNVAFTLADCCENHRPTAARNPESSFGCSLEGAASCAKANAELSTRTIASGQKNDRRPARPVRPNFKACLVPITGETGNQSARRQPFTYFQWRK